MRKKNENKDELGSYTSEIIRGPERSVKAMLLAEHLILSVTSPPLKAIRHIVEAASMLPDEEMKKLEIDAEEVETLLTLSSLFSEPADFSDPGYLPLFNIPIVSIALEWARYFEPWVKMRAYNYWTPQVESALKEERKAREAGGVQYHVHAFRHLSEAGYKAMTTDFITWSMPKAQRIAEKISSLVDQRTFTDIMKIVQKPIEAQR